MKSLSELFAVIVSGCLVLASGCVVMDPAEEAGTGYTEAEWADELLDEAALEDADLEQGKGAGDQGYETMEETDDSPTWPDPITPPPGGG